jgi:hypothetical protein
MTVPMETGLEDLVEARSEALVAVVDEEADRL